MFMLIRYCVLFLLFGFLALPAHSRSPVKFNDTEYDINVKIDPINRTIEGKSTITVNQPRELQLMLGSAFEVTEALFNDGPLGDSRSDANQPHVWNIPMLFRQQIQFVIHWRGSLASLDTSLDHQQTLGRPIAVTGEAGTFLPDGSNWYPRVVGQLVRYKINLELPAGQKGLAAGRLIEENESEHHYRASFEFAHPAEGIDVMAGPYVIESTMHQGRNNQSIRLRTYFHPQISGLSSTYLDSVKRYIDMYESMVGAYPFTEFSVVSSPTPTGFGMPTLTYLGIDVLKLPFIPATSLGHEVLHNWWGNGVYADYRSGNWTEGLTTFMADYAYKELESPEAARDMRVGWLRDFAALQPGQDAPLTAFTSRTHSASKIVGYSKAAMLFFMLRDQLGEAIFQRALMGLWTTRKFMVTSWRDVQKLFEMISGQNLQPFFTQWLERTGAPAIAISEAKRGAADSGHRLTITLAQSAPAYQLRVPIAIRNQEKTEIHWLDLSREQQTFTLTLAEKPEAVALDPDARIFRQLNRHEAPPILREAMVNPATETMILADSADVRKTAEALAEKLQQRKPTLIDGSNQLPADPIMIIGLQPDIDAWLNASKLPSRPDRDATTGTAQAWAMARDEGAPLIIVSAKDAASLEALIRPLPHYGRHSYIAFDGRQAIVKGVLPMNLQWTEIENH